MKLIRLPGEIEAGWPTCQALQNVTLIIAPCRPDHLQRHSTDTDRDPFSAGKRVSFPYTQLQAAVSARRDTRSARAT
jgi:hypothetical protein